jgi:hypothetical protein
MGWDLSRQTHTPEVGPLKNTILFFNSQKVAFIGFSGPYLTRRVAQAK